MSSRALRKLQQKQELEAEKAKAKSQEGKRNEGNNEPEDEDSEEDDSPSMGTANNLGARAKMPPHRNPFDLVRISKRFT